MMSSNFQPSSVIQVLLRNNNLVVNPLVSYNHASEHILLDPLLNRWPFRFDAYSH